ncbi:hypothetical protein ACJDT4_02350 [Clostridium neuense]|uniref:Uncharacterized protein n=1 Tax=Clostridium neuense TaxID=1728934 RepID=A0ABW8TC06_9CLOT
MAEYHLDINGGIKLGDYSSIHDYMEFISKNDKFTIMIEKSDKSNIDIICKMLTDNRFNINNLNVDSNGRYHIEAYRDK